MYTLKMNHLKRSDFKWFNTLSDCLAYIINYLNIKIYNQNEVYVANVL